MSNLDNEIVPEGLFVVSGKVVDKKGNGIKKADIRLKNDDGEKVADTKSKKNGAFELKKVSSGYYVIQASKKKIGDGFVRVKVWGNDIETQITIPSDVPPKLEQNSLSESNILGTLSLIHI